jgi:nicotinamide-nucleotide amidase
MTAAATVTVALVAIGDELLAGDQVNGNGVALGRELSANGFTVVEHQVVGDDIERIAAAVRGAASRASAVIVCGGLGPTQDDVTRDALAVAAGVAVRRDPALERQLQERFAARAGAAGVVVPAMNMRQADLPVGALPLANEVGTAPGVFLFVAERPVYALPGVPSELGAMLSAVVLPDLRSRFAQRPVVVRRSLRTVGLWESAVAEALAPEVVRTAGDPQIAFLASGGETRVVVTATAPDRAVADERVDATIRFARGALGEAVYDRPSLEAEIVHLLGEAGATVACAESLTAGLLTARIANVPGASNVLRGGIVAYSTDLKSTLLGLSRSLLSERGAVSSETAAEMASGVREQCTSTYGVALTGDAGPDRQEGHPPGTVFAAIHGPAGASTRLLNLPGDRDQVRALAVTSALAMLRVALVQDARGTHEA